MKEEEAFPTLSIEVLMGAERTDCQWGWLTECSDGCKEEWSRCSTYLTSDLRTCVTATFKVIQEDSNNV